VDAETRAYLDQTLGVFRDDVSRGFATLHREFGVLRAEFDELRREVRESAIETRRHFDVVAEYLRHDIRGIAEGVIALSERVDRLGVSVRAEMNERFTATHAVVRVAFSDVRHDIAELRSQL
jgi:hypothetical protein